MSFSENFKEPRVVLTVTTVILLAVLLFYCVASMVTSIGYQTFAEAATSAVPVFATANVPTVILDAGHGGEDPGAVAGELLEKELNLAICDKLASFLKLSGCRVILTRTDDRMLYRAGEESHKKFYDLKNRADIAKAHPNAVFISIHMNIFPAGSCSGLQTFYSTNCDESKQLATAIQESTKLLLLENHRTIKSNRNTIYLLNEIHSPAVLIECGFLSNAGDAERLKDPLYQDQLAYVLYNGICSYLEVQNGQNELCLQ